MNFFLFTSEVARQVKSIKTAIRLSMNGMASSAMTKAGISYNQNFGLYLPAVKAIAANYKPDVALAVKLWSSRNREEMMIAILLFPPSKLTLQMVERWAKDVKTEELARQFCLNMVRYADFAPVLVEKWIVAETPIVKSMGWLLASRLLKVEDGKKFVDLIVNRVEGASAVEARSMAVCLRTLCKASLENAKYVQGAMLSVQDSSEAARYVLEEVRTELIYGPMADKL
jgi:hypothetical protein